MKSGIVESASVEAGGRVLVFRRRLNARPQSVWAALTDPDKLRQWYAQSDDYPFPGNKYELYFENTNTTVHATIIRAKRPSVLEYRWESDTSEESPVSLNGSIVRFELESDDESTTLTVNHIFNSDDAPVADVLAGWQTHLDELVDKLQDGFGGGGFNRKGVLELGLSPAFKDTCGGRALRFAQVLSVDSAFARQAATQAAGRQQTLGAPQAEQEEDGGAAAAGAGAGAEKPRSERKR